MSHVHIVAQGEHLAGIAAEYGFDYEDIWNHPDNAALKLKRKFPYTLFPGDQLIIPDREVRVESAATDMLHQYKLLIKRLVLRLAITDFDNRPLKQEKCKVIIEGTVHELVTNGEGKIEIPLAATAKQGTIVIPRLDMEIPIEIGHLDPLEEESGWRGRLINLGYYDGSPDDDKPDEWRWTLEEFQCDMGLPITGEPDAATLDKLKSTHGC